MNFATLDEAFGRDPYLSRLSDEPEEHCDYDVGGLQSYAGDTVVKHVENIIKPAPQPMAFHDLKKIHENLKIQPAIKNQEMINAMIYIVSGVYVIFILDMFVRMGGKMC